MAQIEESGKGRTATIELNLVPFIDLMSVCIIFLLLTAVWTQVSMIQIGSSVYGKRNDVVDEKPPEPKDTIAMRLDVKPEGYILNYGTEKVSIPKQGAGFDNAKLLEILKGVKVKYPEKNDSVIALADELTYDDLIVGMDHLMMAGFGEISVATGGVQ